MSDAKGPMSDVVAFYVMGPLYHLQQRALRLAALRTAFFHRPDELRAEIAEAGFAEAFVFAVEGPAFVLPDFAARWSRPEARDTLLRFLRTVETEPLLMGASPHLLACARRP